MSPTSEEGTPAPAKLDVTITSLEMAERPARALTPLPPKARVERLNQPTVAFYRFLYDTVGEPWLWADRRRWTDEKLIATIQDPAVEVWVLAFGGRTAGYAELDRRNAGAVELAYLGLLPEFIGRGLGTVLLDFAIISPSTGPGRAGPSASGSTPAASTIRLRSDSIGERDSRCFGPRCVRWSIRDPRD